MEKTQKKNGVMSIGIGADQELSLLPARTLCYLIVKARGQHIHETVAGVGLESI